MVYIAGLVTGVILSFISICLFGWWYNEKYPTAGEDIIVVDSLPVDTLWSLSDDFAR